MGEQSRNGMVVPWPSGTRLFLSCSSAIFDTCFHFTVQDDCSRSLYHMCMPASRKGEGQKKLIPSFGKTHVTFCLCSFVPSGQHLFEEEGEKCNLCSAQLCIQLKMGGSILRKKTRKGVEGQFPLCPITVTNHQVLPYMGACGFPFLASQVPAPPLSQ